MHTTNAQKKMIIWSKRKRATVDDGYLGIKLRKLIVAPEHLPLLASISHGNQVGLPLIVPVHSVSRLPTSPRLTSITGIFLIPTKPCRRGGKRS